MSDMSADELRDVIARALLEPIHDDEDRCDQGWDDVSHDRFYRYADAVILALDTHGWPEIL